MSVCHKSSIYILNCSHNLSLLNGCKCEDYVPNCHVTELLYILEILHTHTNVHYKMHNIVVI